MTKRGKNRGTFKYPLEGENPALAVLDDKFVKAITVQMNQRRGAIYEQMSEAVLRSFLLENLQATEEEQIILRDTISFLCFPAPAQKRRRFDLYLPTQEWAIEIKSYRVGCNAFIREQIQKDSWLLEQGIVKAVLWILWEGATRPSLQALDRAGLLYLNVVAKEEGELTNWKEEGKGEF